MNYFLILFLFASNILFAEQACVDLDKVIKKSLVYLDLTKKLDDLQSQNKKEFEGVENNLQKRSQNLVESRDQMSAEDFEKKQKELRQDIDSFQERVVALKKKRDDLENASLAEINKNIELLSWKILEQEKYSAIVYKQSIFLNRDLPDITERLLKDLNEALPQMSLSLKKESN